MIDPSGGSINARLPDNKAAVQRKCEWKACDLASIPAGGPKRKIIIAQSGCSERNWWSALCSVCDRLTSRLGPWLFHPENIINSRCGKMTFNLQSQKPQLTHVLEIFSPGESTHTEPLSITTARLPWFIRCRPTSWPATAHPLVIITAMPCSGCRNLILQTFWRQLDGRFFS